jgi:hypothetical protein
MTCSIAFVYGTFAGLRLLYRAEVSADPAETAAEGSAERAQSALLWRQAAPMLSTQALRC